MLSKMKYRHNIIKALLPYTSGVQKYFLLMSLCTLLLMVFELLTPGLYKLFIDRVILDKNLALMKYLFVGYLLLFSATTLTGYIKEHSKYTFLHGTLYRVKEKIFLNFLHTNPTQSETLDTGEQKMRLEDDTALLREFAETQTVDFIISFLTLVISTTLLLFIDWRLTLFALTAIPVTFLLDDLVSQREKNINAEKRENASKKTAWLQSTLQGWREVKALGLGRWQLHRYLKYVHVQALCNARWINCWTARVLIIPKIKEEFFMRFGLYFLGGLMIAKNMLEISDLLVFVVYYEMLSNAMKKVSAANAQLQADMPMLDRLLTLLSLPEEITPSPCPPTSFTGMELVDVTYRYPGSEQYIVQNLHIHIAPGDRIAITGKSGAGKTTVLKLLTGMLAPTSGQVLMNGQDLQALNHRRIISHIGYVMQENTLFHMSIRENLRYGRADATESDMWKACEKAAIATFIRTLPQGLDTVIGEKGIKLSGGQRQRLVLARLLLKDTDIYILDEATSALDEQNEALIHSTLMELSREKTLIVVSHRESSLSLCDRIIHLE